MPKNVIEQLNKQYYPQGDGTYKTTEIPSGDPTTLPLATKSTITDKYQGSFKIAYSDGVSSTDYAMGRVAYNPANDSVFVDSHNYQSAVAEFAIPATLSTSTDKTLLPNATNIQGFREILPSTTTGNTSSFDRLGGMAFVNGELFIQAYKTYDLSVSPHTTAVVRTPNSLSASTIDGFFEMGGAARTVNYISPVPAAWQALLGGDYLAGNGAGMSIDSRNSMGPSMYTFNSGAFSGVSGAVPTTPHINYPVATALSSSLWPDYSVVGYGAWDVYNTTLLNDMWASRSHAGFGFIVPGTRTFAAIGSSGMHDSGGGYKITNDQGFLYPGSGPQDANDFHSYYWLYDLNEVLAAGNLHDPIPYEYGVFDDRFTEYSAQGAEGMHSGGSFDASSGKLVLCHKAGTSFHESGHPVVSVYDFS